MLAPLFLNHFVLRPGQATFLGPNEPHAYLAGDCVECMACSDNTIRAGLTPKFKDVQTLCASLTYQMTAPPFFRPRQLAPGVTEYAPPVREFAVQKLEVGAGPGGGCWALKWVLGWEVHQGGYWAQEDNGRYPDWPA